MNGFLGLRRAMLAVGVCLALVWTSAPAALAQTGGPGLATWQAGPGASGDSTLAGAIEMPGNGGAWPMGRIQNMSGWVVDTSAQGWTGTDDVQIWLGTMEGGGTQLGDAHLGVVRTDVASALGNPYWNTAGWSATVDPGALTTGPNTILVYAHTPSKGWWFSQVGVNVGAPIGVVPGSPVNGGGPLLVVSTPANNEMVSDREAVYKLTGTARDPALGARGIDWVQVWLNGEQNTDNAIFVGDPDMSVDGSWELDFSPWAYTPLASNLYVYAHSDVTGKTTLVVVHFFIVDH